MGAEAPLVPLATDGGSRGVRRRKERVAHALGSAADTPTVPPELAKEVRAWVIRPAHSG